MKTWPIINEGKVTAFEVSVIRIGLGEIMKVLESTPGVSRLEKRRLFSGEEIHLKFSYNGVDYVVWEPFGDNSRYWIGPADEAAKESNDVGELERVFRSYRPSLMKRLFGL